MRLDKDLASIQAVRNLVAAAKDAARQLEHYDQGKIDTLCAAIAQKVASQAEYLAKLAVEETGFGIVEHKIMKNLLGSTVCWDYIKPMKTVGVITEDKVNGIIEVGTPVGIVAGILPSTNPTSTTVYKALISLKGRNPIVFSPHPGAVNCILETVKLIKDAIRDCHGPEMAVQCIDVVTMPAVNELIRHRDVGIILATGGEAMVRAAYSSGNPAIGVGPGNGPAFIEQSADIPAAVGHIFESKTFDNGTICASEQSIVTEACIAAEVEAECVRQGAYFLNEAESETLARLLLRANGSINPVVVGKSALVIARMAGLSVPASTTVLISRQYTVGEDNPYSREKLCPILGYYVEDNWEKACNRCIELLVNEGIGHTMVIHSTNEAVIREFALHKPVSRLLVNTPAALGGVGATTNLPPAFTLGCGAIGKSATSDNVTPLNLINIRRIAYGTKAFATPQLDQKREPFDTNDVYVSDSLSRTEIEAVAREVLARIRSSGH